MDWDNGVGVADRGDALELSQDSAQELIDSYGIKPAPQVGAARARMGWCGIGATILEAAPMPLPNAIGCPGALMGLRMSRCGRALPPSAPPLDHPTPIAPDAPSVRRLGGRWFVSDHGLEESPGSTGIGCRLMAGGGDLRESATENKPPRCGDTSR